MAMLSADLERKLRNLQVEIHSIALSFPEPSSAHHIKRVYEDAFDYAIDFKMFGYDSLNTLLDSHPDMERVYFNGNMAYRAKLKAETAHIQSLVSKQKKKKKKPTKPQFSRSSRTYSSFTGGRYQNTHQTFVRNVPNRSSLPSMHRQRIPPRPTNTFSAVSQPLRIPPTQSAPGGEAMVATGIQRIRRIVEMLDGRASSILLAKKYQELYGSAFDKEEMMKLFGTSHLMRVYMQHLKEFFDVRGSVNNFIFISKELLRKAAEWNSNNHVQVIPSTVVFDKPSIKQLYDNIVKMMVDLYPTMIKIGDFPQYYQRRFNVAVEPTELYSKTWDVLFSSLFKGKLMLENEHVRLRPEVVAAEGLEGRQKAVNNQERREQPSLALQFSDSSDESEEYEDDDDASVSTETTDTLPIPPCFTINTPIRRRMRTPSPNGFPDGVELNPFGVPIARTPVPVPRVSTPVVFKTEKQPIVPSRVPVSIFDRLSFEDKKEEKPEPKPEDADKSSGILKKTEKKKTFGFQQKAREVASIFNNALRMRNEGLKEMSAEGSVSGESISRPVEEKPVERRERLSTESSVLSVNEERSASPASDISSLHSDGTNTKAFAFQVKVIGNVKNNLI